MNSAVFDTSPLCYLVLIDEVSIAPRLFDRIFVPSAVEQELSHSGAPKSVRKWIADPPTWLQVRDDRDRAHASRQHLREDRLDDERCGEIRVELDRRQAATA